MSILSKVKKLSSLALHPGIIASQSKYLFILGHMRSRSSVLSHILGSNEGVCGYSELHLSYESPMSLLRMRLELHNDLGCDLKDKYLLDKILHNKLVLSKDLIQSVKPKVIFLIREPESTLKSIIYMGQMTGVDWYQNPKRAQEYYCSRLSNLEAYAALLEGNYFFLEADELVKHSDLVLARLSDWLSLKEPLDANYSTFNHTASKGRGDPLDNIRAGTIKETESHASIEIPEQVLQLAHAAYTRCQSLLKKNAVDGMGAWSASSKIGTGP
ncbi:MAG: sulfotransferase family protein [Oleiphilus sp.]|nr:MAG: sulfotransferase family protein [Oleiphilus sp.]